MESSVPALRKCKKCGEEKPLDDFPVHGANKKYHYRTCKKCFYLERSIREKNKGAEHAKKVQDYQRAYRKKNKDILAQKRREYYQSHREELLEQKKEYAKRDSVKKRRRKYEQEYWKKRRKVDPVCDVARKCRSRLHSYKQNHGFKKPCKTKDMIGCEWEELWAHLQKTWIENYGTPWKGEEYNIDHITPLAVAKTVDDVKKLFHYTNLQMLTPEDNLDKRAKIIDKERKTTK